MAETLGIDPEQITLTFNDATGEVTYILSTPDFNATSTLVDVLEDPAIIDALNEQNALVDVASLIVDSEIVAEVTILVNADEASIPLPQAENTIQAILGREYETEFIGNFSIKQ